MVEWYSTIDDDGFFSFLFLVVLLTRSLRSLGIRFPITGTILSHNGHKIRVRVTHNGRPQTWKVYRKRQIVHVCGRTSAAKKEKEKEKRKKKRKKKRKRRTGDR